MPPATGPATVPATGPASRPALGRPVPRAVPVDANALTDKKVGESIRKGADWLYKQFDPKSHTIIAPAAAAKDESHEGGLDALCVYALMQSGLALRDDPRFDLKKDEVKAMLEAMCTKYDLTKGNAQTYAHGLRATALALVLAERGNVSNKEDRKLLDAYRNVLMLDTRWSLGACDNGAYTYVMRANAPKTDRDLANYYGKYRPGNLPAPAGGYDNSNSQYGLLGVWSAAEVGVEIPVEYWAIVDHHWMTCQLNNGQWPYSPRGPRPRAPSR